MPMQHVQEGTAALIQQVATKQRWTMAVVIDEAVRRLAKELGLAVPESDTAKPALTPADG